MFCNGCGKEVDEGEKFCVYCGKDLSKYQQKSEAEENPIKDDVEDDDYPEEYEDIPSDFINNESLDSESKIKNLTDIISRLQAENIQLKRELEEYYRQESPVSKSKTQFGRKPMPKPDKEKKDDVFTKFKKWYNE